VLTFFHRDDVFAYVTQNAERLNLTSEEEIKQVVGSLQNNLSFLAVCLGILILVQTVALVLASFHFKRACLLNLNTLTRVRTLFPSSPLSFVFPFLSFPFLSYFNLNCIVISFA
jgi:hypothetical protein